MEIKEIDGVENKKRFMCNFNINNTKMGVSFLEAEGLYKDIGVILSFGPVREENNNYVWGNFSMNRNEVKIFNQKIENDKTEILNLITKIKNICVLFLKQYPQYTCLIYKSLSNKQEVLYNELINNSKWISNVLSTNVDIKNADGYTFIYPDFGIKRKKPSKEDLFRVKRGDYMIYAKLKFSDLNNKKSPEFFKELKELEQRIGEPIFKDIKWE